MNILALDTSSPRLLVAVKAEDKVFYKTSSADLKKHNSALMPYIDEVLKEAGLAVAEIDGFAAVSGPGSFTGIRVGVSTVNAFSQVTGKPAVGISSLRINPIIPAGNGNFYALIDGIEQFITSDEMFNYNENYDPQILLNLAEARLLAGECDNLVAPNYLRKPQAERNLEK